MKRLSLKTLVGIFVGVAVCTASVFAANTITIDSVSISPYEEDGVENTNYAQATVKYTATVGKTPLKDITFALSATTPEHTLAGNEAKVVYLNEISAPTATNGKAEYSFVIEKARVQSALGKANISDIEGASLFFKMGGTDVAEAASCEVVFGSPKNTLYGDVNMDEKINTRDVTLILKANAQLTTLTTEQVEAADVNGDGKVNTRDVTLILKYNAQLITYDDILAYH